MVCCFNASDGALNGYVLDLSGAVIVNAKLIARNIYNFHLLGPGVKA